MGREILPLGELPRSATAPANPRPCSECPWRTENHGQPHPDGWFTKRNRDRLWAKLRRGESMSCHKTDPSNPVPTGVDPVKAGTTVHECTGALILQQRETMNYQACQGHLPTYKATHPKGMTRIGLVTMVERTIFGGVPLLGAGVAMARPNLNEPVSHDGLNWNPPTESTDADPR